MAYYTYEYPVTVYTYECPDIVNATEVIVTLGVDVGEDERGRYVGYSIDKIEPVNGGALPDIGSETEEELLQVAKAMYFEEAELVKRDGY